MSRLVPLGLVSLSLLAGCASRPPTTLADCEHALLAQLCARTARETQERTAAAQARQADFQRWYASLTPDQQFQYQMQRQRQAFEAQQASLESMQRALTPPQPVVCSVVLNNTVVCN